MNTDIIVLPIDPGTRSENRAGLITETIYGDGVEFLMIWYNTGMPRSYATFDSKDGERGISVEWHDNGHLKEYFFHKNGDQHGEYRSWESNGVLIERLIFIDDVCVHNEKELSKEDRSFLSMQYGKIHFIEESKLMRFIDR